MRTAAGIVHGGATAHTATAPMIMPQVTMPIGWRVVTPCSPSRKYAAEHTAAPSPASRPTASRLSPCHTCATPASPAIASAIPAHMRPGSRTLRTNRVHSAISTGEVNSSRIAMPTGSRPAATK